MTRVYDRWEFYQDPEEKWWWRRFSRNKSIKDPFSPGYEILVDSSKRSYEKKDDCVENAIRHGYKL
jgi:hypothetical protein